MEKSVSPEAYADLLIDYYYVSKSLIWEYSDTIRKDEAELLKECEELARENLGWVPDFERETM